MRYYCTMATVVSEECSGLSNCMKEKLVTKESYHRLDKECQTNVTQNQMLPGRQDKNDQNENITARLFNQNKKQTSMSRAHDQVFPPISKGPKITFKNFFNYSCIFN